MEIVYLSLIVLIGMSIYCTYSNGKWKEKYTEQLPVFQLIEESKDVIYQFEVNPKFKFKYISPSLDNFLGGGSIEEALLNPKAPFERIHPDDHDTLCKKVNGQMNYSQTIIQRWKDVNGNYRWFEEYTTPIFRNGEFIGVQGIMRNIDEKVKLQQALEYQISHDALTNIHNRDFFEKKFEEFNKKINTPIAIIICDLDELKNINDNYGHKKGDELIKASANLLNSFSSQNIIVARLGGDEFVLLAVETEELEIKKLINNIRNEVENHNADDSNIKIKVSIGFASIKNSIGNMSELFSLADKNMYMDKLSKKQIFSEKNQLNK